MRIQRALLSTWDKTGLVDLAKELAGGGVALLATGGTLRALREAGLQVTAVEDLTGHAEMLGGRVKTLHPAVHAGILAPQRAREEGIGEGYEPIDLVVVNLYPFEKALAESDRDVTRLIEMIDIGGPTMLRAAAKNHDCVAALSDPSQYAEFLAEWTAGNGSVSAEVRRRLALAVFQRTQDYDAAISSWLETLQEAETGEQATPQRLRLDLSRARALRYGENPHQSAALYLDPAEPNGLAGAEVLQGKPLSYNNLLDADGAFELLTELAAGESDAVAVVVKHLGPCGAALGDSPAEALEKAFATDPVSAFGGVIAVHPEVGGDTARQITAGFYEIVVAESFTDEALEVLAAKKNLRILRCAVPDASSSGWRVRGISGGVLLQARDNVDLSEDQLEVVTKRQPTDTEWRALRFAWRVCKHVRSNAIVFTSADQVLGVGGGQPNRVGACRLAMTRAAEQGHDLEGSAVASDAFFPFRDGVDVAHEAGASCIIQPGGSIRDEESIQAADEHGMAMVFTGLRHFRH